MKENYNYQMVVFDTINTAGIHSETQLEGMVASELDHHVKHYRLIGVRLIPHHAMAVVDTDEGTQYRSDHAEQVLKKMWKKRLAEMFPDRKFRVASVLIKFEAGKPR